MGDGRGRLAIGIVIRVNGTVGGVKVDELALIGAVDSITSCCFNGSTGAGSEADFLEELE